MLLLWNPLDFMMKLTGFKSRRGESRPGQKPWLSGIVIRLVKMTLSSKEVLERTCPSGAGWPDCGSLTTDTMTREVRSGAGYLPALPMEWGRRPEGVLLHLEVGSRILGGILEYGHQHQERQSGEVGQTGCG